MEEGTKRRSHIGIKITVTSFIIVSLLGISMSLPIQTKLRPTLKAEGLGKDVIDSIVNNFTVTTLVYILVSICLTMLIGFALSRTITKPIQKLREGVERIRAKNWDYRVDIKTGDEIEELSKAFNEMAAELQKHIMDLYRREETLLRQVKELRIKIDEARKVRQVAEITETEYFRQLQEKARQLRRKSLEE